MNEVNYSCPICQKEKINVYHEKIQDDTIKINCDRCGDYIACGRLISYGQTNENWWKKRHLLSAIIREMNILNNKPTNINSPPIDFYLSSFSIPSTPKEQADRLLFLLSKIHPEPGERFILKHKNDYPLCYGKNEKELQYFLDFLENQEYIKKFEGIRVEGPRFEVGGFGPEYVITIEGWTYINEISNEISSNQFFNTIENNNINNITVKDLQFRDKTNEKESEINLKNEILKNLYKTYFNGKDTFNLKYWLEMAKLDKNKVYSAFESLERKHLCKMILIDWGCCITTYGILEVERMGIIDNSIIKVNRSIRTKILETIHNFIKNTDSNNVMVPEIAPNIGITEEEFYIHLNILKDLGYTNYRTANSVELTGNGFNFIENLKNIKELQKEYKSLKMKSPQERGREFDIYVSKLIATYGWETEPKIIRKGEEIDGYIKKDNVILLVECKWQKEPIEPKELRDFNGKLESRSSTDGIFLSMSGYTKGAIDYIIKTIPLRLIIPFGCKDIEEIVMDKSTFDKKLQEKIESMKVRKKIVIDGIIYE